MPRKHKDVDWQVPEGDNGAVKTWDYVQLCVLLDIRDELKQLNATLGCYRVGRMTDDVARIDRRLAKHLPLRKGTR